MSLMRDDELATKDVALAENTFETNVGGLKEKTKRSKPLSMQSQEVEIPRELLFLYEKVETSLD